MSCSVHDMIQLERKGIATATVCTSGFRNAGAKQATMLGIPNLPIVDIPFPFASLPPEQARARGAAAFDAIVAALTKREI
ncbi:MAG: UGSC family (seleno)protein [Betaproteobacteria bacterium]